MRKKSNLKITDENKTYTKKDLVVEVADPKRIPNGKASYDFNSEYDEIKKIFNALFPIKTKVIGEKNKKIVVTFLKVFYDNRFEEHTKSLLEKLRNNEVLSKEELGVFVELSKKAHEKLEDGNDKYFDELLIEQDILKKIQNSMIQMIMLDVTIATINSGEAPMKHIETIESFIKAYQNAESLNQWRQSMENDVLKEKNIIINGNQLFREIEN